jgi:hypothetical protein
LDRWSIIQTEHRIRVPNANKLKLGTGQGHIQSTIVRQEANPVVSIIVVGASDKGHNDYIGFAPLTGIDGGYHHPLQTLSTSAQEVFDERHLGLIKGNDTNPVD